MNVNQATTLIILMLLFMSVGGFQREGLDFLWYAFVCSVTATIIVTVADYLYEKISGV
jgi:uncharacterized membrane protein